MKETAADATVDILQEKTAQASTGSPDLEKAKTAALNSLTSASG
jgi:hypothetical protein